MGGSRIKERYLVLPETPAHKEGNDLGILDKRCTVGIVGREHAPPRIFHKKGQLNPDRPHDTVHKALAGIIDRDDPGPGLELNVMVAPLVVMQHV